MSTSNLFKAFRFNGMSRNFFSTSFFIYKIAVVAVLLLICVDPSFSSSIEVDPKRLPASLSQSLVKPVHIPRASSSSISHPSSLGKDEVGVNRDLLEKDSRIDDGGSLSPATKSLFFGEDANGVPIVIGTWFRYGSYTLAFSMFGTAFLIACSAAAVYYTLFVVTDPSQLDSERSHKSSSADNGMVDNWSVGRVLRALQLAYETYETFDMYNPVCQLKTVCEIQESSHFQGSLLRRLLHFLIHTELVQRKLANAEELQAADRIGNEPAEKCQEKFSECRFSLSKLYESYVTI